MMEWEAPTLIAVGLAYALGYLELFWRITR